MLVVISGFASLPASALRTGSIDPILIWGYFVMLTIAPWSYYRWNQLAGVLSRTTDFLAKLPKKWIVPPLLATAVLATLLAGSMPDDRLHVSFLNVGQGDAILIQTPTHQDILVDGGPSPQALNLELGRRLPFWDRTIELVVLTHPHADHLTGLIDILQRYRVTQVLYPDADSASPLWLEWLNLIQEKGIKSSIARAGQVIDLVDDEITIEVLNPSATEKEQTLDTIGVVMRISTDKVSFLLTADITQATEIALITNRAHLTSTILKVSHHGSDTATSPEFLAVVSPEVAVISVGADNDYGHPSKETMARLTERLEPTNIYRTDKNGTIEFTTDGERLWVKKEK
jgi:competence protein ComEC